MGSKLFLAQTNLIDVVNVLRFELILQFNGLDILDVIAVALQKIKGPKETARICFTALQPRICSKYFPATRNRTAASLI